MGGQRIMFKFYFNLQMRKHSWNARQFKISIFMLKLELFPINSNFIRYSYRIAVADSEYVMPIPDEFRHKLNQFEKYLNSLLLHRLMHSTHIRRHIQLLSLQSHAFEMFCRISNSCGCIEIRCYRLEPIKRKIPQRVIVCGDFNLAHNRESHLRERCYLMRFKLNIIGITSTIRIMWWYCSRTNRAYYWKCVDCFLFLSLFPFGSCKVGVSPTAVDVPKTIFRLIHVMLCEKLTEQQLVPHCHHCVCMHAYRRSRFVFRIHWTWKMGFCVM